MNPRSANRNNKSPSDHLSVIQLLPALEVGGVERGTLEIAKELVRLGHRSIVISGGGQLVDELVSSGSEHLQLDIGKKSILSLRHILFLRKYFQKENIDIIHARSRLPAWLTYLAWKKMSPAYRPRFITTVHGPYSVNSYSKVMTKGQSVIATSEFIFKYITDNYPNVDKNKITLIHRGVSKTEFPFAYTPDKMWLKTWQEQHPMISNNFILTMPARVTRWKGHEDFLNIVAQLKQQNIPAHGLIAGGPHRRKAAYLAELKEKTRAFGLENEITFLGHRNDVKEIMSISDIVLSLAKEPEAFGRTALEALCLGKPVIAYNHGGAAEILANMYPYGCVTPNDSVAICDKIISFYEQPVPVQDNNFFTLDRMLNDTLALYTEKTK
jgi:glycosyltransferase involved in cell wall biosynthesis